MRITSEKQFYQVKIDRKKQEVRFDIGGRPNQEEVNQFINDYQKAMRSIEPTNYTLVLDGEFLRIIPVQMLPTLEACFALYRDSGFKKILFNLPESATLKMQISRLSKKIGLTNAELTVAYPKQ